MRAIVIYLLLAQIFLCSGGSISCSNCAACSGSHCTECNPGYYLSSGSCYSCDGSCNTCLGPSYTQCTSCFDGSYLNSTSGNCASCHSTCQTCSGPFPTQCLSCLATGVLTEGLCLLRINNSCDGLRDSQTYTFSGANTNPIGQSLMKFDGTANNITLAFWLMLTAPLNTGAQILRLSANDTAPTNPIISIEAASSSFVNVILTSNTSYPNQIATRAGSLSTRKWYWFAVSRSHANSDGTGISDTFFVASAQMYQEVVNGNLAWPKSSAMIPLNTRNLQIIVNGFNGSKPGFNGTLRNVVIGRGLFFTNFLDGFIHLGTTGPAYWLSTSLLYLSFDSNTGQKLIDNSPKHLKGVFGYSSSSSIGDPTFDNDTSLGLHMKSQPTPTFIELQLVDLLGPSDDTLTVSFQITLTSPVSCTTHVLQRWSMVTNEVIYGIRINPPSNLALVFNNVEINLNFALSIGVSELVAISCSNYGGISVAYCYAYANTQRILDLTLMSSAALNTGAYDEFMIGDSRCGFDGYIRELLLSKEGSVNTGSCFSCGLTLGFNSLSSYCPQCRAGQLAFRGECRSSCPTGFIPDFITNTCSCPSGYYITNNNKCEACNSLCGSCFGPSISQCYTCTEGYVIVNSFTCQPKCQSNFYEDPNTQDCIPCNSSCSSCTGPSNTQCQGCNTPFVLDGTSCICPNGTYLDGQNGCSPCYDSCRVCNGPNQVDCCLVDNCKTCDTTAFPTSQCLACLSSYILFQGNCVTSCPVTYYLNTTTNSCLDCYLGCATCTSGDNSSCTSCWSGYYLYNGSCIEHCPFNTYLSSNGTTCYPCDSSCVTCNGPSNNQCTLCTEDSLLLAGSCVDLCPLEYYQQGIDADSGTLIPQCSQKQTLQISLNLTSDPRIIKLKFNFSISRIITLLQKILTVTVGNVTLSPELYQIELISDSEAEIGLLSDMQIQVNTQMNTALNLNPDFDTNQYNEFQMPQKNATIGLQEIYPFTTTQSNFIRAGVSVFNLTSTAGITQVVETILSSGLSTSLVRFKLLVDSMQSMQFIAVNWPPMVSDFYSNADTYPSNLVLPVTIFPQPSNDQLRNISVSTTLQTDQITTEFLSNYSQETSNLMIYFTIALIAHLLNRVIEYKYKYSYKRKPKILELIQLFDTQFAWRFFLIFYLSIYDTTYLYGLIQLCYPGFDTPFLQASMVLAVAYIIGNICLLFWVVLIVRKLTKIEDERKATEILKRSRTSCLLNDYRKKNRLQPYFVPIFMLRDTLFSILLVSLQAIPILQVIMITLVFLLFLIYIVVCRPLEDKVELGFTILIEGLRLLVCICTLVFAFLDATKSDSSDVRNGLGWTFLGINFTFILVLIIISIHQAIKLLRVLFRRLKRMLGKKQKIAPINEELVKIIPSNEYKVANKHILRFEENLKDLKVAQEEDPKAAVLLLKQKLQVLMSNLDENVDSPQESLKNIQSTIVELFYSHCTSINELNEPKQSDYAIKTFDFETQQIPTEEVIIAPLDSYPQEDKLFKRVKTTIRNSKRSAIEEMRIAKEHNSQQKFSISIEQLVNVSQPKPKHNSECHAGCVNSKT